MASSDEETFYTPQRSEESAYSDSPSSPISRRWCRKLVGDCEGAARGGARAVELGLGSRRPTLVDEVAQAAGGDERRSREARASSATTAALLRRSRSFSSTNAVAPPTLAAAAAEAVGVGLRTRRRGGEGESV
uniref:Uncharacterized protein n=1 Tax=Ananas comosus var. bracteatus TaxID=296719 RepID=A0A6V7QJE6_ANACO|nr:unnamed protein product [Ananas comosus var. bracteatus]